MTQGEVLAVFQEALLVAMKISAPLLIASIAIGLVVAIFQCNILLVLMFARLLFCMILLVILIDLPLFRSSGAAKRAGGDRKSVV